MGEAEPQNEPTMEEILASIRRIISEDDPEEQKSEENAPQSEAAAESAEPQPTAEAPAEPAEPNAEAAAPVEPEPEEDAADAAEEEAPASAEVLDLTKMVNADGSVTDLDAEEAAEEEAVEAPAEETEEAAEPPAEEAAVPDADAIAALLEEPAPEDAELPEASEEEPPVETPAEPAETSSPPSEQPENSLVSPETAALAAGAMAAITRTAVDSHGEQGTTPIGDGRTLEDVVRAALVPELKSWLDANLPDLVERIVREEIKKMVRRAEQQ